MPNYLVARAEEVYRMTWIEAESAMDAQYIAAQLPDNEWDSIATQDPVVRLIKTKEHPREK